MHDLIQNYTLFLRGLSPSMRAAVETFNASAVTLTVLLIWEKIRRHRRGSEPRRSNKKAEFIVFLLLFAAVFYLKDRLPWLAAGIAWPDRHFQMWRDHNAAMFIGFLLGVYAAQALAALYAVIFLRRPAGNYGMAIPTPEAILRNATWSYQKRTTTTYEDE